MIRTFHSKHAPLGAGPGARRKRTVAWCAGLFLPLLALSLLPGDATAARGGQAGAKSLTITFDDLADDAIRSDGQGSYDGALKSDGSLVVRTGKKRAFFFDFSDCVPDPLTGWAPCYTPFGGDGAGEIAGVTLTIPGFAGEAGTSSEEDATISFVDDGTQWKVVTPVVVTRTSDGQGGVAYSWRAVNDDPVPVLYHSSRGFGPGGYYPGAWFYLSWGADGP